MSLQATTNEPIATVFRPFTSCMIEYTSLYALAYDLENRKEVFRTWSVNMNGKIMSVKDWLDWFYHTHILKGAEFYEKV